MPIPAQQPDKITLPDGRVVDDITSIFQAALQDPAPQAAATTAVERIQGPILFLGGSDDHIWPSCTFGSMLSTRLKNFAHPYPDEVHCYSDAGHLIGMPGFPTTDLTFEHPVFHDLEYFGGTPAGTAHAQREGWEAILNFVEKNVRRTERAKRSERNPIRPESAVQAPCRTRRVETALTAL